MTQSDMAVAGPAPHGLLGRLVAESAVTRGRLDLLTSQTASGSVARTYSGLGSGARTVLDLRPTMAAMEVWQTNITTAKSRADIALAAMDRMTAIASDFYARVNTLNGLSATDVDTTAMAARDALREFASLLNTKNGDIFVFSGRDTGNAPVPNGDAILSSGFYTQISLAVSSLGISGAAVTSASTLAIAGSNSAGTSPFSAFLSQPASSLLMQRPLVYMGEQYSEEFGLLASTNAAATSGGTSTTESYMRDILRALATLGSLSSTQIPDSGFAALIDDTRTSLRDSITAMTTDIGVFGAQQARLQKYHEQLGSVRLLVAFQVSRIEDVDMAATLASLSEVQNQLQASYQMISSLRDLSLVKYLS